MDDQGFNQQPEPQRASFLGQSTAGVFTLGAFAGAVVNIVSSLTGKRPVKLKETLAVAGTSALATSIVHLIFRKPTAQQEPLVPTATLPPVTPPGTDRPDTLALATIPQILDLLVSKGDISAKQQQKLIADIKSGRTGFVGEFAVADGYTTKEKLDAALAEQAVLKTQAAIADIQAIETYGTIPTPPSLTSNWGNNGLNPTAASPTPTDGMSAAANIAQNLVMLANTNPDKQTLPVIRDGIIAAANLVRGIEQGNSAVVPLAKMGETWRENLNNALILAVQANPHGQQAPHDAHGKPIDIYDYIAARNAEMTSAIQQTLEHPPQRGTGQSR